MPTYLLVLSIRLWFQKKRLACGQVFFHFARGKIKCMRKTTTILFFTSVIPFASVHWLAETYYLYDAIRWIDIPMHFFGGVIVALALFAAAENGVRIPVHSATTVVWLVVSVAIGWEVFEWFTKDMNMDVYVADTTLDLIMGTVGGYVGYVLGSRLRTL